MSIPERKREQLITALLSAKNLADAARKSGVSLSTVHRMLKDEEFMGDYHTAQTRLLERAVNRLRTAATCFAETLHSVSKNPKFPSGSRAMAASRGLELLLKASTLENLEQRLAELERNAATIERRR